MARDPSADEPESLPEAFWSVAGALRRMWRESLAPWDINPSHSRALGMLERHGTMRLSELSDHLRIAPRSATEVVDALQERGLVERQDDPNDRRATLVALTTHGAEVGAAIRAARTGEADRFFGRLSAPDQAHLARILSLLGAHARPRGAPSHRYRQDL